jgi:hypothetical protein
MRVFGLDFTSNPTRSKQLTLAICRLDEDRLRLERLQKLNSERKGDFSQFEAWLKGKDKWSEEREWIAGLDFPFGMPLGAIEHFGWLATGGSEDWRTYVAAIHAQSSEIDEFQKSIESWKKINRSGASKRSVSRSLHGQARELRRVRSEQSDEGPRPMQSSGRADVL